MKKIYILLLLVLFVGCRPTEKVVDRKTKVDSTVLAQLQKQIFNLEKKNNLLFQKIVADQKLSEKINLKMGGTLEKYDTSKPNNPLKERYTYSQSSNKEKEFSLLFNQLDSTLEQSEKLNSEMENLINDIKLYLNKDEKTETSVGLTGFQSFQIWSFRILILGFIVFFLLKFLIKKILF